MTEQPLPHDVTAEQAVLGSLLIDADAIASISDSLPPEAFYVEAHRVLYRCLLWLWRERIPANYTTIVSTLEKYRRMDAIGGVSYLTTLMNATPTAVYLSYYADIVRDFAHRRAMIEAGADLVARAYADSLDVDDAVCAIRRAVEPFTPPSEQSGPVLFGESIPAYKQRLQDIWDGVIVERFTPTGVRNLDAALWGGLRPTELMIMAAMSSMGKTALMLAMAQASAEATGRISVIASLEMSEEAIKNRMGCALAGVPYSTTKPRDAVKIYDMAKRARDEQALLAALDYLATLPIAVLTAQRTTDRILVELDRLSGQGELGLVAIDHIDHLEDAFRKETDEQRFAELAKRCKGIALRANVPAIVLAQLHRGVESKSPYLPEPGHIRGSGRIREITDVLVMPYRRRAYVELGMLEEDLNLDYLKHPRGDEHKVDLFLFKNRNGETGTSIALGFEPKSMAFADASDQPRRAA